MTRTLLVISSLVPAGMVGLLLRTSARTGLTPWLAIAAPAPLASASVATLITVADVGVIASTTPAPLTEMAGVSVAWSAMIVAAPVIDSALVCEFHNAAVPDALSHAGRV